MEDQKEIGRAFISTASNKHPLHAAASAAKGLLSQLKARGLRLTGPYPPTITTVIMHTKEEKSGKDVRTYVCTAYYWLPTNLPFGGGDFGGGGGGG